MENEIAIGIWHTDEISSHTEEKRNENCRKYTSYEDMQWTGSPESQITVCKHKDGGGGRGRGTIIVPSMWQSDCQENLGREMDNSYQ